MMQPTRSLLLALLLCLVAGPAPSGEPERAGGPEPAEAPAPEGASEPQPAPSKAPSPPPSLRNIGGPGDYAVRVKLVKRLADEPELANSGFKVVLVNGGAVFSGTVPTWSLKRRALTEAGTSRGIVHVTDQMQVARGEVSDEQILAAVSRLLKERQETLGIQSFEVEVLDGEMTLSGVVKDFGARVRAEEVAGSVQGVMRLVNRLLPADAPSGADDVSIRKAVATYLGNPSSYPYHGEIEIQVKEARVVLTGRLAYFLARQQAGAMTALVGGVSGVDNRIKVDPSVMMPALVVKELP